MMPSIERSHPKLDFADNLSVLERFDIIQALSRVTIQTLVSNHFAAMPCEEKLLLQYDTRELFGDDREAAENYTRSIVLFRIANSGEARVA